MFASHELMLDLSFAAARARLTNLTHGDWLSIASDAAYAHGLTGLIKVGVATSSEASEPVALDLPLTIPLSAIAVGTAANSGSGISSNAQMSLLSENVASPIRRRRVPHPELSLCTAQPQDH